MARFINKSDILSWNEANLRHMPDVAGVYCLRDVSRSVIYIGSVGANRLKARLMEHYNSCDVPGVQYFDCYQCISGTEARALEKEWIQRYQPLYNQVGK